MEKCDACGKKRKLKKCDGYFNNLCKKCFMDLEKQHSEAKWLKFEYYPTDTKSIN